MLIFQFFLPIDLPKEPKNPIHFNNFIPLLNQSLLLISKNLLNYKNKNAGGRNGT